MILEVAFIIEMTIANPVSGSFKAHAQEIFGEWWGFVVGWNFWTSAILGMASEVIACSIFMRLWFPDVQQWVFCLLFSIFITTINFSDVKGLSKMEFGLSVVKIATLVIFILVGILIVAGLPISEAKENFRQFNEVLTSPAKGLSAIFGSMLLVP